MTGSVRIYTDGLEDLSRTDYFYRRPSGSCSRAIEALETSTGARPLPIALARTAIESGPTSTCCRPEPTYRGLSDQRPLWFHTSNQSLVASPNAIVARQLG